MEWLHRTGRVLSGLRLPLWQQAPARVAPPPLGRGSAPAGPPEAPASVAAPPDCAADQSKHAAPPELREAQDRIPLGRMRFRPEICCNSGRVSGYLLADPDPTTTQDDPLSDLLQRALRDIAPLLRATDAVLVMPVTLEALCREAFEDEFPWLLDAVDLPAGALRLRIASPLPGAWAGPEPDRASVEALDRLARAGCGLDLPHVELAHALVGRGRDPALLRVMIPEALVRPASGQPPAAPLGPMCLAVLSLCERGGLDSAMQDVDDRDRAGLLAQIGCGHLSGPAIAPELEAAVLPAFLAAHALHMPSLPRLPPRPQISAA